jgi:hypothetical protein
MPPGRRSAAAADDAGNRQPAPAGGDPRAGAGGRKGAPGRPATERLNGWLRLWIAIALLGLVPAAFTLWSEWESGESWIRDREVAPPTRVQVEGVGDVEFPATMSREAIELVTQASKGNAAAIRAGIHAWDVEFRRVLDAQAAALNRLLVLRVLGFWAAAVGILYAAGLLGAWVRRGFKI